jgi:CO/xanthine dehydrogenase Mo-binding subunit
VARNWRSALADGTRRSPASIEVYQSKAPGGLAYACSFRITEAAFLVERMVDCLAFELQMDPAELRMKNLLRPEQFQYTTPTGWSRTPATTPGRCAKRCASPATTSCARSRPPSAPPAS